MKLVSACLCGINCNYKGKSKPIKKLIDLVKAGKAITICPEQLGGLPTPRPPAEINKGTGSDVLAGKSKVITCEDKDITKECVKGAFEVLKIAEKVNATEAILTVRSPSCGSGKIYDGTFSHTLKNGDGVTAALLKRNGLKIIIEGSYEKKQKGSLLNSVFVF
jgi:uncharacterized protein YbbK (DUF523 family)